MHAMLLKCIALLMFFMALAPAYSLNAAAEYISKQAAYDLLKLNKNEKVLALIKGDREVLLATLELERHQVDAALAWLSHDVVQSNPLAALIKGEAFRRKSLAAALRAGNYAHAAYDGIKKLGNAELTPALREADKRLQAFMRIDKAPIPVQEKQVVVLTDDVRESVKIAVQGWLEAWQSRNHKAYMSHYDAEFQTEKYDYQSWSQYKKRINQKKAYIHIQITDMKIQSDNLSQGNGVIVSFEQAYQSSNYTTRGHKELYLFRRDKAAPWLILEEGSVVHAHHLQAKMGVENSFSDSKIGDGWVVNIASFQHISNAQEMVESIDRYHHFQPFVAHAWVGEKKMYRVRAGIYHSPSSAKKAMRDICTALDIPDCWLEKR
ncbi:MAG: hypothetical protein COB41_09770 [Proteobacteria bacterium]|nr:MAG: hypothetical protein COB41_09770 [Pseudomonadota bacterium]